MGRTFPVASFRPIWPQCSACFCILQSTLSLPCPQPAEASVWEHCRIIWVQLCSLKCNSVPMLRGRRITVESQVQVQLEAQFQSLILLCSFYVEKSFDFSHLRVSIHSNKVVLSSEGIITSRFSFQGSLFCFWWHLHSTLTTVRFQILALNCQIKSTFI